MVAFKELLYAAPMMQELYLELLAPKLYDYYSFF